MAGFGNSLEQKIFELLLKRGTITVPTTVSIGLHYADPGETGANELHTSGTGTEGHSPGYARVAYATDANVTTHTRFTNPSGGGTISTAAQADFAAATGHWNQQVGGGAARDITHWSCWGDLGAGVIFLFGAALTTARQVTNGAQPYFASGALTLNLD